MIFIKKYIKINFFFFFKKIIATTLINQQQPGNYLDHTLLKKFPCSFSYVWYPSSLIIIANNLQKGFIFFLRNNIASTILQSSLLYSSANLSESCNLIFKVARLVEYEQLKHHIEVTFAIVASDCMNACSFTAILTLRRLRNKIIATWDFMLSCFC
jgi:hypothetical protein